MPDNLDFSKLIAYSDEIRQLKAGDWVFEIGDDAEALYVVKSGAIDILVDGTRVEVVPAATDYQVLEPDPSILDWLPNAEALMMTTLGIKEHLGWWVYRARGWVD